MDFYVYLLFVLVCKINWWMDGSTKFLSSTVPKKNHSIPKFKNGSCDQARMFRGQFFIRRQRAHRSLGWSWLTDPYHAFSNMLPSNQVYWFTASIRLDTCGLRNLCFLYLRTKLKLTLYWFGLPMLLLDAVACRELQAVCSKFNFRYTKRKLPILCLILGGRKWAFSPCSLRRVMSNLAGTITFQFKTECKGDSHSSKTANIILPGLMIKQRCTAYVCKRIWSIQIHSTAYVGWNNSSHPSWYYISRADGGRSPLFYHESWENDICNFRAMTVDLTVSFKLISF